MPALRLSVWLGAQAPPPTGNRVSAPWGRRLKGRYCALSSDVRPMAPARLAHPVEEPLHVAGSAGEH